MRGRVIHTGQAVVDLVMNVPSLPVAGGDVFATSHQITAGGGFNVMAAASRDGSDVLYLGGHGTGRFGDIVRYAMAEECITVTQDAVPTVDTGFSVAIVDASAERTFVSTLGAEGYLTMKDLEAARVREGDVVYVSGYSLYHQHNGGVIADWLPELPYGVHVVVDPSPMIGQIPEELLSRVIAHTTVWTTNESEARVLAARLGIEGEDAATLAEAIGTALNVTTVVRANRDGAWVAGPGEPVLHVESFPVAAVDTNGAGDAHTGVLCAGLAQGRKLVASVRRANAAAAVAVTRRGPATSPSRAEIDALLGKQDR
ncbi:PfkB family carbohydrate kinase [Arthrobacter sp. NPDC090010]|uniref:PfkB family carbohydrate kinase n=1 Tax=Arthrobacter sp. NPDC090010 TaxID=3363942 RepID=UPI0038300471